MAGYLGYDPDALRILLGALDVAAAERLEPSRGTSRWAEAACDRHRQAVARLVPFAQRVGAVLHGDPLGRYRPVCLDPSDLGHWALHHGGAWATVTDPAARPTDEVGFAGTNARAVAAWLTPACLAALLDGDGGAASGLIRYLRTIAAASTPAGRAARRALLTALGPDRFGALVSGAASRFLSAHQWAGPDLASATRADRTLGGLGALWAAGRADGQVRGAAWDAAAVGNGSLYGASRLLAEAAAEAGALDADELARFGAGLWRRLAEGFGGAAGTQPELVGNQVLSALARDGRAARTFLLDLADHGRDGGLALLLTNGASAPSVSGTVLLASTDPGSVTGPGDDDEVRRSVQAVLRAVERLAADRPVAFPRRRPDDGTTVFGRTLPADLGLYSGRWLDRMVDPGDGAAGAAGPGASRTWAGWEEREVARLLGWLSTDPVAAGQLRDAALAGFTRRIADADLAQPDADEVVATESFVLAATLASMRQRSVDRAIDETARFDRMAAGLDLAVVVAGHAVPGIGPVVVGTELWGASSDVGAVAGVTTPGELALRPFRPRSVRDALAASHADERLDLAVTKSVVVSAALEDLVRAGRLAVDTAPRLPVEPSDQARALAAGTRPGDNANAAGNAHLAEVDAWLDRATDQPGRADAAATVRALMAVTGDASAAGAAWVA